MLNLVVFLDSSKGGETGKSKVMSPRPLNPMSPSALLGDILIANVSFNGGVVRVVRCDFWNYFA
jgi:hypothetical protein